MNPNASTTEAKPNMRTAPKLEAIRFKIGDLR